MNISQQSFGKTDDGTIIELYTLSNHSGLEVKIINYGGTVVSALTPDRNGHLADVVLGFDNLAGYLQRTGEISVTISRPSIFVAAEGGEVEL